MVTISLRLADCVFSHASCLFMSKILVKSFWRSPTSSPCPLHLLTIQWKSFSSFYQLVACLFFFIHPFTLYIILCTLRFFFSLILFFLLTSAPFSKLLPLLTIWMSVCSWNEEKKIISYHREYIQLHHLLLRLRKRFSEAAKTHLRRS